MHEPELAAHVPIHDRTAAEITGFMHSRLDLFQTDVIGPLARPDGHSIGTMTYADVRTISFSSVSSAFFPCMSSRICFERSILPVNHSSDRRNRQKVCKWIHPYSRSAL